jgi:hypothetical protein
MAPALLHIGMQTKLAIGLLWGVGVFGMNSATLAIQKLSVRLHHKMATVKLCTN